MDAGETSVDVMTLKLLHQPLATVMLHTTSATCVQMLVVRNVMQKVSVKLASVSQIHHKRRETVVNVCQSTDVQMPTITVRSVMVSVRTVKSPGCRLVVRLVRLDMSALLITSPTSTV
jgi:hypothetical protein